MFASTRRTITPGRQLCWKCRKLQRPSGWEVCALPLVARKIISLRKMLKREAVDFDNEGLGIRGCCCVFGLWRVSCLGGSVCCTEDSTTTCRWWHRKTQKVSTYISKTVRINEMPLFLFKKIYIYIFFHFRLHSLFPGLHQKGCCIIVFGCCGPLAILTVAGNCQGAWHPFFPQPFLKEAVIHWVASCHLGSMSPTWHTSSWASSLSTSSVTAETIIKWQKNVFGCPEAR